MTPLRPTVLTIDLSALRRNFAVLRGRLTPHVKMMLAVKADAYGHDMLRTSRLAKAAGVDALAVATPDEGIVLRENGIEGMILVLGGVTDFGAYASAEHDLSQAVFTAETLCALNAAAAKRKTRAKAHVKVDTGMTRIGVREMVELDALLDAWRDCPNVDLEGIFTHFAAADAEDSTYTRAQFARFLPFVERVKYAGFSPIVHCCNSAGAINYPEYHCDMVRYGIAAYGGGFLKTGVIPAQTLTTRPVRIETLPPGTCVGYGCTFVTTRDTIVATIPIGYGDGYRRTIGNIGYVLVRGQRAKVIGRVCMDQCMVDVTDVYGVSLDDEFVLLGTQGDMSITPENMAAWCSTISYEVTLSFTPRIPRVFVDG